MAHATRVTRTITAPVGTADGCSADGVIPRDEKLVKVYQLARQYEDIRATMPSGQRRTQAMGQIARQILSYLPLEDYDSDADLLSPQAGRRLVAYLSLVAEPDTAHAEELAKTLTEREGIPHKPKVTG
jgi:hypothetical protein